METQKLLPAPNGKKLYWIEQIDLLREGKLAGWEIEICCDKAGDWTTCACGGVDEDIPKIGITQMPKDPTLYNLGYEFNRCWKEVRSSSRTEHMRLANELELLIMKITRRAIEVTNQIKSESYGATL